MPTRPRGKLMGPSFVAGLGISTLAPSAPAYEASADASFELQYYSVASPFGDPVVSRRRYTSTLGLDVVNLQGRYDETEPTLAFRSRLRVDADFGVQGSETNPASRRFVPGLEQAPLELLYAYLEGERFLQGLVGFRAGRQYLIDSIGFWSFDGALLRLSLPIYLELSGFLGVEQRPGLPVLTSGRFSGDGVWRGERSDLELYQYPSFLDDSALAPAAGATLETSGIPYVHASLSYRKVQSRSTVIVSPFLNQAGELDRLSESRTSSERAGASLRIDIPSLGAASASAAYDLYVGVVSRAAALIDVYASRQLTVGADVEYDYPTYDADSIFNWFSHGPTTLATSRVSFVPNRSFDAALSFGARFFETHGDPNQVLAAVVSEDAGGALEHHADTLANVRGTYRLGEAAFALSALGERGDSGHRVGADVSVTKSYRGGRHDGHVILSLYDWSDALRASRDATSFTYVLGASTRPFTEFSTGRLGVEWEHSMNRLVGQRFRLLFTVDLTVLR